jgi:hypothetical protein
MYISIVPDRLGSFSQLASLEIPRIGLAADAVARVGSDAHVKSI